MEEAVESWETPPAPLPVRIMYRPAPKGLNVARSWDVAKMAHEAILERGAKPLAAPAGRRMGNRGPGDPCALGFAWERRERR